MDEEGFPSRSPSLGIALVVAVAALVTSSAHAGPPAVDAVGVRTALPPRPECRPAEDGETGPAAQAEEEMLASGGFLPRIARAGLPTVLLFYPPSYLTSPPQNQVTPPPAPPPTVPPSPPPTTPPPPPYPPPPPPPPPPPGGGNQPPPEQPPPASQPEPATLISGLVGSGLLSLVALYRRRRRPRRDQPAE